MPGSLSIIALAIIVAAVLGRLPQRWRLNAVLIFSLALPFNLQPVLPIPYLDFMLPLLLIFLCFSSWVIIYGELFSQHEDRNTLALVLILIIALTFMRYLDPAYRLTSSRPPEPGIVFFWVGLFAISLVVLARWQQSSVLLAGMILLIIAIFVIFKTELLSTELSAALRTQTGRDPQLASGADLVWLGYSYVAFRLIHTLRDAQGDLLPRMSLAEYLRYVLFFPAFIAGPIDRAERFIKDEREDNQIEYHAALMRIAEGLFLKFIVADTLGQGMALTPSLADEISGTAWYWLLLYGYGLRLYADFAGYSAMAIGIGLLLGIRLPENFQQPYRQTNITAFWQSWHITLSTWMRHYVFTPVTRALLKREKRPSTWLIVLSAQFSTMILIGLWHGVSINFLVWGIWHAAGLFIHKQWSDYSRRYYRRLQAYPLLAKLWQVFAWCLCFNFVMLGWVWFALSDYQQALRYLAGLAGIQS